MLTCPAAIHESRYLSNERSPSLHESRYHSASIITLFHESKYPYRLGLNEVSVFMADFTCYMKVDSFYSGDIFQSI